MQILDARLSRMLKFQVQGGFSEAGQLYTTNTMIPVNYPWVAAYIGTNWVHIFPWLKDYEITEGFDLYDEMPTNYPQRLSAGCRITFMATPTCCRWRWMATTRRASSSRPFEANPAAKSSGRFRGRPWRADFQPPHYYARWQDFPTPTWVTNISTRCESLDFQRHHQHQPDADQHF